MAWELQEATAGCYALMAEGLYWIAGSDILMGHPT